LLEEINISIAQCAYSLRWQNINRDEHVSDDSQQPHRQIKAAGCPFQRPFLSAPPSENNDLEAELRLLKNFIITETKKTASSITPNLTVSEQKGLKLLLARKNDLHFSVSDKGGEFVINTVKSHKDITIHHLKTTPSVYKWIPPTRKQNGVIVNVKCPTDTSFRNQIKSVRLDLENKCNKLLSDICNKHSVNTKFVNLLSTHHTSLPTMYTLIKTHKLDPNIDISTVDKFDLKVRPIVSCTNSPTEKLAWLVTHILKPLLHHVPTHLSNIHSHLELISNLPIDELRGLQFFSADISALYTNLSATGCIESLMEMAEEFWESLNQLDQICFTLTDIRNILTLVFKESYFTFNSRLYYQTLGLFMGCCPSPLGAIIRVWKFEKSSLYTDVTYISSFYGRYVDDCGSFAKSKELAVQITTRIEEQDPSGRLKFEVDFPETPNTYTPFLDTEIMVDSTGNVNTRLYRKPQKKNITLHWRSHHTTQTKREVAKNFYRTARKVSSGPEQIDHSIGRLMTYYDVMASLIRDNGTLTMVIGVEGVDITTLTTQLCVYYLIFLNHLTTRSETTLEIGKYL